MRTPWIPVFFLLLVSELSAAERPNIVFILIDDLGWRDIGCYGNRFVDTPNIDQLAKEGMRFTDFYAAGAVCSPTRASIQSGQNQARFGLTDFIPGHWRPFERVVTPQTALQLPLETVTIGEALSGAGYRTGYFGKWHLSWRGRGEPWQQGYEEAIVTSGRHFAPGFQVKSGPSAEKPPQPRRGEYLADYLTDRVCEFIRERKEDPFFAFLSHYAVHIPLQARRELVHKYEERSGEKGYPNHPVYAAMIEHCDRSVAKIISTLKELEIDRDTVVVFTSDNGGLHKRFGGGGEAVTVNRPLRGEKGMSYEGGVRVPLIVRWPGQVPAGSVCRTPAVSHDFYPTFVELAGTPLPVGQVFDGRSMLKSWRDENAPAHRRSIFFHYPHYHHSRPASALRQGNWKLIEFLDDGSLELYNLATDLGEATDLARDQRERASVMHGELDAWRRSIGAAMPTPNPAFSPTRRQEWWSRGSLEPVSMKALEKAFDELRFDPTNE